MNMYFFLSTSKSLPRLGNLFVFGVLWIALAACGQRASDENEATRFADRPHDVLEYAAAAEDFDCMLASAADPQESWHKVRNFYLKNMTGRTQEALDVANGLKPAPYPVGTVIQLIYFEAMVKRASPQSAKTVMADTEGWEFFALDVSAGVTKIESRGGQEVVNFADGNCYACHKDARPEFDLVCESSNGCEPLPISDDLIHSFQKGDPRCK
jgi:hypothetical protein